MNASLPMADFADVLKEREYLRETLRTVACAIPAEWKHSRRPTERKAYEVLSAFLIEDQRGT